MDNTENSKQSSDNSALYISSFVREFLAVSVLLLLEARIRGYDYLNSALVLFLVLLTVRLPYINSYAYIFETVSMRDWSEHRAHGLKNDAKQSFKLPFFLTIFTAHITGAIAAAAARVYFDVQFGTEIVTASNLTSIRQGLTVDIDALPEYASTWLASDRTKCFKDDGLAGHQTFFFPINDSACISSAMRILWYVGEDAAYVFLLCVCYIHIWLGSGISSTPVNTKAPPNPKSHEYWMRLFKISVLLTLINMALLRAFPTAHGSLHNSVYMSFYQNWGVNVKLIDTDNSELAMRIVGGFVGVLVGYAYNSALVRTFDPDADKNTYKLWWGFDPPPAAQKGVEYAQFNGKQPLVGVPEMQFLDQVDVNGHCTCDMTHHRTRTVVPAASYAAAPYSATQLRIPYSLSAS